MPVFQIITFGCKVNQCDSAWLAQELVALGWQAALAGEAPEIVVVNTCTVTARADQQARQMLRRLARQYPQARLAVTGCYAQRAPGAIAALPQVRVVCGNRDKPGLPRLLGASARHPKPRIQVTDFHQEDVLQGWELHQFPGHSRAWLKIQEGCDQRCSYCIVPTVRGPGRSLTPPLVRQGVQALAAAGYPEVVLTGINLGRYGVDLEKPPSRSQPFSEKDHHAPTSVNLAALITYLARHPWPCRLRFSSLEPQEISPGLLDALASWPDFCPHFHLPLQSGAAAVLAAMSRPYRPQDFQEVVWDIRRRFPDAAIGLDVLVGFPTETAADFEATYTLVASLPVSYLHVFPFSPRPGTPAATLPLLPATTVQARAQAIRLLGRQKKRQFYQTQVGRMGEVVVEGQMAPNGWSRGLSANYLRVLLSGVPPERQGRLQVRYIGVQEEFIMAEPVT